MKAERVHKAKLMIRYKVVTKDGRKSVISRSLPRLEHLPETSPLILTYEKGKTVKAHPLTPGILVFRTKQAAEEFVRYHGHNVVNDLTILRVRSHGKARVIHVLLSDNSMELWKLHMERNSELVPEHVLHLACDEPAWLGYMEAPRETLAYPSVTVLD